MSVKKNTIINTLSGLLVFFSLILLFVIAFYLHSNRTTNMLSDGGSEGMQAFVLTNDIWSARDGGFPLKMREFYRELRVREEFETIIYAATEIQVQPESFQLPEHLSLAYLLENDWFSSRSLGVNILDEHGLENHSWQLEKGRNFDSHDFLSFEGTFPLIAGSYLNEFLELDDTFEAIFQGMTFTFQIIGFLEEDHPVPTFGQQWADDFNHLLVMPFIDFEVVLPQEMSENSQQWERFLWEYYFDFLQPWLLLEDTSEALDMTLNTINALEEYFGIHLVFPMAHRILFRNPITRNIITMNLQAISSFQIGAALLISLVLFYFSKVKYLQKRNIYHSLSLMGVAKTRQIVLVLLENILFTGTAIFFAVYYVVFGSQLIVHRSVSVSGMEKWFLLYAQLFGYAGYDFKEETTGLLWLLIGIGIAFYGIQAIYPIFRINKVYQGGVKDA